MHSGIYVFIYNPQTSRLCSQEFDKSYIYCNEELQNLYSSPSIIKMSKSRRMRWAGHVARLGRRGMRIGYWWEIQKEKDN
jgi:hypothetical protein